MPNSTTGTIPTIIENRGHNVFVKNTCLEPTGSEVSQSHKLTTHSYSQSNVSMDTILMFLVVINASFVDFDKRKCAAKNC